MTTEYDELVPSSVASSASSSALARTVSDARQHFESMCIPLRPVLHRFCTRMTGSPCDGEDVLQDALITAFYRIGELENMVSFRAWVFRIAHNKCIDFVRARARKQWFESDVDAIAALDGAADADVAASDRERAQRTLSHIVTELPPRERACVVLRDVLDWSLEETAQITGSSVGAVKAALHRARTKLVEADSASAGAGVRGRLAPADRAVAQAYLAAFNRRDWDAVQALLADDARLEVVHRTEGSFEQAPYFSNYAKLSWAWMLQIASVDGVERIVHFRRLGDEWLPHAVVELAIVAGKVTRVRDYVHVDYLLRHCAVDPGIA